MRDGLYKFVFVTHDKRELHDYEYTIEVNAKTFEEAITKAVKELPLGSHDNIYSRRGVEWHLKDALDFPELQETYTNDAPENEWDFDEDEWEETDPHGVMRDLIRENYKQD